MELNKKRIMDKYGVSFLIIVIQIVDVFTHALTNQLEMIRVQSNIVIVLWTIFLYLKTSKFSKRLLSTLSISIYLILNFLFIFQFGIINQYSGDYRIALILFVISTASLSFIQTNQFKKRGKI